MDTLALCARLQRARVGEGVQPTPAAAEASSDVTGDERRLAAGVATAKVRECAVWVPLWVTVHYAASESCRDVGGLVFYLPVCVCVYKSVAGVWALTNCS